MDDYPVTIQGSYSLGEINDAIAGEECGASEFQSSKVSGNDNTATFLELPPGTIPPTLTVVKKDDPQPPGTAKVWEGEMRVSGAVAAVIAYRFVGPHGSGGGQP